MLEGGPGAVFFFCLIKPFVYKYIYSAEESAFKRFVLE